MKRVFLKMASICYYSVSNLILITFFATTISSCSNDDDGSPPVTIKEISQDIKNLI